MNPEKAEPSIEVSVVCATPGHARSVSLCLPVGATLGQALVASALIDEAARSQGTLTYAVFGQRRGVDYVLASGDRVEILRPLQVTPNEARLLRARARGKRSSR
jgi:putative ubiquitin-RnfH superfamily antitoxin RatB of RatAB toxin-antitoxin module